jgi:hypothetical protein
MYLDIMRTFGEALVNMEVWLSEKGREFLEHPRDSGTLVS